MNTTLTLVKLRHLLTLHKPLIHHSRWGTSTLEKLRLLLTHWVEHNREHAEEYRRWAAQAERKGEIEVASCLNVAAAGMEGVNDRLLAALDTIGGPLEKHK